LAAIGIPDFSYAPAARQFGSKAGIAAGISEFNRVAVEEAGRVGFPFIDIFDVSRAGTDRPGWISDDQLHPGDAQYSAWAEAIWRGAGPAWTGPGPTLSQGVAGRP